MVRCGPRTPAHPPGCGPHSVACTVWSPAQQLQVLSARSFPPAHRPCLPLPACLAELPLASPVWLVASQQRPRCWALVGLDSPAGGLIRRPGFSSLGLRGRSQFWLQLGPPHRPPAHRSLVLSQISPQIPHSLPVSHLQSRSSPPALGHTCPSKPAVSGVSSPQCSVLHLSTGSVQNPGAHLHHPSSTLRTECIGILLALV